MKITHANVQAWAKERGLEPVQIDGIPEGFSFKEPDITIGDEDHIGGYVAYVPLSEWVAVYAPTTNELLTKYQQNGN